MQIEKYKKLARLIPEEILKWIIEMINFHKFTSTNAALTGFNPGSKFQSNRMNAELAAIVRTMDYFLAFFEESLPNHEKKIDVLTGKEINNLQEELTRDYETRKNEIFAIYDKLIAKDAKPQDGQIQEISQDIEQQIDTKP